MRDSSPAWTQFAMYSLPCTIPKPSIQVLAFTHTTFFHSITFCPQFNNNCTSQNPPPDYHARLPITHSSNPFSTPRHFSSFVSQTTTGVTISSLPLAAHCLCRASPAAAAHRRTWASRSGGGRRGTWPKTVDGGGRWRAAGGGRRRGWLVSANARQRRAARWWRGGHRCASVREARVPV